MLTYAVLARECASAQRRWVHTCGLRIPVFSNGRSHRVEQSLHRVNAIARQDANTFGDQPGMRRLRGRLIEQVFAGGAFHAAVHTAGILLPANGRVHFVPHAEQR